MIKSAVLGALLFAFWLALSGHYTPFLISMGVLSSACALYAARRMGLVDDEAVPLQLRPRLLLYWLWLGIEIVRSSLSVARLILSRRLTLTQQFVLVPTSQKSEMGRVIFANSITLTPGTVTVVTRERDFIVHALTDDHAAPEGFTGMDRRVTAAEAR
jgi:multicomponent Na+:H+ antiporter subunit E